MAPPLNQVFQNDPFDRLNIPSYSIGAARKSILESVQLELTEFPDVRRMDPETLQKLTELIVAHYTPLNPATAAALDKFVPVKNSFLITGGSIVLSLFSVTLNFPFYHRQARALCCAPRRFFKNKSGEFIHVTNDIKPDSESSFLILTRNEFTALRAPAKEVYWRLKLTHRLHILPRMKKNCTQMSLHKPEPSVPHLHWFWPPSLQLRYIPLIPHKLHQTKYRPQVMYHSVKMYKVHHVKQVSLKK